MDAKNQQFLIENGMNHSPNSDSSTLQCIEHRTLERSSTTVRPLTFPLSLSSIQQRRIIKSEPTDYENMSDITIDTNTDLIEDLSRNGGNSSASNQPPFGTSNMVCVSDLDLLRSNGDSDIEFINNCLPSMAFCRFENPAEKVESHQSTTTTTTTTTQLVIAASKPMNKNSTTDGHNKPPESSKLVTSNASAIVPNKKVKRKQNASDNELKKNLRPKSNDNVNYSLVRRRKDKLLNPVNKVRQMIKEEKESNKQSSNKQSLKKQSLKKQSLNKRSREEIVISNHRTNSKYSSILKNKRKNEFMKQKQRGQGSSSKVQYREKVDLGRNITIKDTDRFKFAAMKTFNRVTTTRD